MSADAWRICPACKREAEAKYKKAEDDLVSLYGEIPMEEFIKKSQDAKTTTPAPQLEETLREDFSIRTSEDGSFEVEYYSGCNCGYTYTFKHQVWTLPPQPSQP